MQARAPGVIKLFGEHAVVYGYTCIAAAIDLYVSAEVTESGNDETLTIITTVQGKSKASITKEKLRELFCNYGYRSDPDEYIRRASTITPGFLHYAAIASRLYCGLGINVLGKTIKLTGNLPTQKGLASSAASSTAFLLSLLEDPREIGEEVLIDMARDGERVLHRNVNAGRIDVSASFYGGCVSYDSINGAKREKPGRGIDLMIVDTGPKKSTAEMVGHVSEIYEQNKSSTENIFKQINECAVKGMAALKSGDARAMGGCMFRNHDLLGQLGVSTPTLDKLVEIAKDNCAAGAKLSGGGGGGIGVVLIDGSTRTEDMISEFQRKKFGIMNARISPKGAYDFLRSKE